MPAPRRALMRPLSALALFLLLVTVVCISPAVASSEQTFVDEGFRQLDYSIWTGTYSIGSSQAIRFYDIQEWKDFEFYYFKTTQVINPGPFYDKPSESKPVTFKIGSTTIGTGTASYNALYNSLGNIIGVQCWVEVDTWDVSGFSGAQHVSLVPTEGSVFQNLLVYAPNGAPDTSETYPVGFVSGKQLCGGDHLVRGSYYWENILIDDPDTGKVYLIRNIDGTPYKSAFNLTSVVSVFDDSYSDLEIPYTPPASYTLTSQYGKTFSGSLGGTDPSGATVTVYVRNSQTGALLAGAHILIEGTPGVDNWTEYVNTTLPSGTGSYSLPGMPYQFRILAESPGYTSTGYQYFRAGDTVIVDLEPYIDAPTNESNTFLEFYIRDLNANPLGGATVAVDGQWLYSNNNGYARFEVPKNATYPYRVTKSGHHTIEGTATVGSLPRYTVNVVLGKGEIPTLTPTLGPGETPGGPGATPTPDRRTNEQKGQAVIDMIADFAEPIALLAIVATVFGLMQMMMPRRR